MDQCREREGKESRASLDSSSARRTSRARRSSSRLSHTSSELRIPGLSTQSYVSLPIRPFCGQNGVLVQSIEPRHQPWRQQSQSQLVAFACPWRISSSRRQGHWKQAISEAQKCNQRSQQPSCLQRQDAKNAELSDSEATFWPSRGRARVSSATLDTLKVSESLVRPDAQPILITLVFRKDVTTIDAYFTSASARSWSDGTSIAVSSICARLKGSRNAENHV